MSRSRNPPVRGQGAARAKQMGLLLDLNPDGGVDADGNDEDLEAELLSLMGGPRSAGKKAGGRAPVPMADIEHMAALCMKDLDEEDGDEDGDLESDADLLAELSEVLEGDKEEEAPTLPQQKAAPHHTPVASPGPQSLEALLVERIGMYQGAISNAKEAGEGSKVRRYDRGLKTLQSMLASVKKGKPIDEAEIPPAVATGGKPAPAPQSRPDAEQQPRVPEPAPAPPTNHKSVKETPPRPPPKPQLLPPPAKTLAVTPDTPLISPLTPSQPDSHLSEVKSLVSSRQREYKVAAIQAKQSGDTELAKRLYLAAKKLDPLIEALDRGETVDVASLPPPPGNAPSPAPPSQPSSQPTSAPPVVSPVTDTALPAPRTVAEALQQRMERYKAAAEGAKSKGDDRKARMHQRIIKQYQDAIRANKAGRHVDLSELPIPPGCPPLQGSEGSEQNLVGVLETALKLANQDAEAEDDDESGTREPAAKLTSKAAVQRAKAPMPPTPESASPGSASTPGQAPKLGTKAQQQLDFLLMRRQQFVRAAVRSKQMKDLQGAALHLRNAKGLDHMITAAKGGLPVDITKVPSVPVSEEDYSLGPTRSQLSPRSSEKYGQLMELLRQQHEKCIGYSQQSTNMGNIAETTRFEKLAEECMKNIEVLKKAYEKSCPVPKFHTEERTFNIVKIFPDLTSNDLVLTIVKGTNLPSPSGGSANDLDASVRFEFPFPSSEEPQHDKTSTVKNSNCPEFKEQFKLNISRGHRSFKRVVQTKGIKFEIIHKGGLFKADRVVGNAQLKLDSLETQCEIRQLLEVLDGRKATGGRLEVRVKIREPLGSPQLQTVTEKWLVLDPITTPPAAVPAPKSKPRPQNDHDKNASRSPPQYKFHSFSLLQYDKDRIEHKIKEYKRNRMEPPTELLQQHRDTSQRLQWQKAHLERAPPAVFAEYDAALCRLAQGLSEGVKKFSSQGNRDAAKDALGRLKMVETEIEALRKRCAT
ncbi:coiled-coil and C2 domain-containing protein 1A [Brienomyrus brachyistius]|uniref:coiled-coil and C2 domain-containing protein 1A n=1 Tax=Brienomyrus brachyistius TaxID=42636 RepID=UPI0020B42D57|nr:coiled-coil and C2 domain-containing protein 1A [Brienomyrus brachyistius]XP_048870722.1 coiled-coil and C2 domain-containing protein 1A [Brienomyrus brachyistius]